MHNPHQIQQLFAQHVPLEYPVNIKKENQQHKPKKEEEKE